MNRISPPPTTEISADLVTEALRKAMRAVDKKDRPGIRAAMSPREVELYGVRMYVDPRDNFTELFIWLNGRPPEVQSLHALVDLVEGRDAFVLDIGANAGVYAVTLGAAAAPGSRVIAFEPNPIMIGRLGYNVRLNDLQDRIRIESCALGLQRGEATLSFVRNNYGEATLLPVASRQRRGGTLVPVRALGEFAHEAEGHDLSVIKIDVEGAEPQVLAPMLRAPNGWLPDAILIETEHAAVWEMDLVAMISDKGYEIALQAEGNTFFVRHGVA